MIATIPSAHSRRPVSARWFAAAGAAAVFSALALTACGPRDEAPLAGGSSAATTPTVPLPSATAVPADPARVGSPVPTTQPGPVAVTPAPAIAPPPVVVAQATPAHPGGSAASPVATPVPPATADDRVDSRNAAAPAARNARVAQSAPSGRMGSIESIEPIRQRPQGTGAGAVIGGVAGAVIGNQFGHGLGRAAMTGVGAAGGAIAGNNVERNIRKQIVGYRVHVRLDNGRVRTFQRSQIGNLHVGDRVRVDGNGFRRA